MIDTSMQLADKVLAAIQAYQHRAAIRLLSTPHPPRPQGGKHRLTLPKQGAIIFCAGRAARRDGSPVDMPNASANRGKSSGFVVTYGMAAMLRFT